MARIFDEKLEGAGYEEAWTEAVGAGCTIDEDADVADVGSPANWGSQCIKFINAGAVNNYTYSQIGNGAIRYTRVEIKITEWSAIDQNDEFFQFAHATENTLNTYCWKLWLYRTGGINKFAFVPYGDGTAGAAQWSAAAALNTLYRFEIEWDSTNDTWEWKINGVSQSNGSLVAGHVEIGAIILGDTGSGNACTFYEDLIAIDDADWVGVEIYPQSVGGHAMAIVGILATATIFLQNVGSHAMAIAGGLIKKTTIFIGKHVMTITGSLNKKSFKNAGGHAMTITGALATAVIFLQNTGGHAMSIAGSLGKAVTYVLNAGGYAINIAGSLSTKHIVAKIKKSKKIFGSNIGHYVDKFIGKKNKWIG